MTGSVTEGRAAVEGLLSPHPFGERLPGPYLDDEFTQRLVAAFDDVLAPVISALDCLDAYWNPKLAPADFLDWLAGWVAADPAGAEDGRQSVAARRDAVAGAMRRHRRRGTAGGLVEEVRAVLGLVAEVTDSGGAAWSATPGGQLPGSPEPSLRLRVRAEEPAALPVRRLAALIDANRPAHVPYTLEVLPGPVAVHAVRTATEAAPGPGRMEDGSSGHL
ncbi:phage tail protein [Kitasatospora sp. MAP5-34]|uniref:phage tail protein n=1 Tax=Kitasatospora sp. MAP5-34 TaxID=3035102 RepID=UPI00247537BE|nr:phage tail protein [Kitasatospora sp. MAP5-34]MDH6577884.1 phage tail-like protein [Kitasatospora sp. MAP5-34]